MHLATKIVASWLLASAGAGLAAGQNSSTFRFVFAEKPGQYGVGLRVVEQYDRTRTFQLEGGSSQKSAGAVGPRPLQTLVWYPAQASSNRAMTVGDYEALIKTETSFGKPVDDGKPQKFVEAFMEGRTDLSAWAVRDATMQTGRFQL